MFAASKAVLIPRLSAAVLVAAALAVPVHVSAEDGGGLNVGAGVSLGSVKAGANVGVGGSGGLASTRASASLGGAGGVNAGVNANVGGSRGLVDAGATASIGGAGGLGANVDATVGGGSLLDANVGIGLGNDGVGSGGGITGSDRQILRQFSQLPHRDRMQMIKRCRGVGSGGYDAALVNLCRLLQTASR